MAKREPILYFDGDKHWLETQPVMSSWSDGIIVLLSRIKERLERYMKTFNQDLYPKLQNNEEAMEAYILRFWKCFSYHWRDAIGRIEENSRTNRNVPAEPGVSGDEVLEWMEASRGYSARGSLGGNPAHDVVLVEALIQQAAGTEERFSKLYQHRLCAAGSDYGILCDEPLLKDTERWWKVFCEDLLSSDGPGKAKIDQYSGRAGLIIWTKIALHSFLWEKIRTNSLESLMYAGDEEGSEKPAEGKKSKKKEAKEEPVAITRSLGEGLDALIRSTNDRPLLAIRLWALDVPDDMIASTIGLPGSQFVALKNEVEAALGKVYADNGKLFDFDSKEIKREVATVLRAGSPKVSPANMATHPITNNEAMLRLAIGELTDADLANLVSHLSECHDCAEEYAKMIYSGLLELPTIREPKSQSDGSGDGKGRKKNNLITMVIAAVACIVLIIVGVSMMGEGGNNDKGLIDEKDIDDKYEAAKLSVSSLENYGYNKEGSYNGQHEPIIDPAREQALEARGANVQEGSQLQYRIDFGEFYLRQHRWEKAIAQFNLAQTIYPQNADIYTGLGIANFEAEVQKGKLPSKATLNYFLKARTLKGYDPTVHLNLAICYNKRGEKEKGKACLEEAVSKERESRGDL